MIYFIYKTTNLLTGHFYIGAHSTGRVNDSYLGSGKRLRLAIKKYGIDSFKRDILSFHNSRDEMYEEEKRLLTADFLSDDMCYNIVPGGVGYFPEKYAFKSPFQDPAWREKNKENITKWTDKGITCCQERLKIKRQKGWRCMGFTGKKHSEAKKLAQSKFMKENFSGERNSQFGLIWVFNLELRLSKKIKKDELDAYIDLGWKKGRKMKFDN